MSDLWKYIVLSDGKDEFPVVFPPRLSHKDMAEGGYVAGLSGWSRVAGRCTPVSAGFIIVPELRIDEGMRSESLGIGPRKGIDQALFPIKDTKGE